MSGVGAETCVDGRGTVEAIRCDRPAISARLQRNVGVWARHCLVSSNDGNIQRRGQSAESPLVMRTPP